MIELGKRSVLGVGVDAVDYASAEQRILASAAARRPMTVTALAVHGVMTGVLDPQHLHRLNRFDLVCPDGQPVRWALNLLYRCGLPERVYGPELTLRLCRICEQQGLPIFLFGGSEPMLEALVQRLSERFPRLQIAGRRASRFRQLSLEERDRLAEEINQSGAAICFVGLGCPRQEVFAFEMRDQVSMPQIAVGAAFAFHAGLLPQAPRWMQRRGLEWLYRLGREPLRLWKRYLLLNPLFVGLLALQRIGLWRGRTEASERPCPELRFG